MKKMTGSGAARGWNYRSQDHLPSARKKSTAGNEKSSGSALSQLALRDIYDASGNSRWKRNLNLKENGNHGS